MEFRSTQNSKLDVRRLHVQPDCQRSGPRKIVSPAPQVQGIPSATGLKLVLTTSRPFERFHSGGPREPSRCQRVGCRSRSAYPTKLHAGTLSPFILSECITSPESMQEKNDMLSNPIERSPFIHSMGSFGVRRSGSSPQVDGSCGEGRSSRGRPRTADGRHVQHTTGVFILHLCATICSQKQEVEDRKALI